jgi:MoxR-like ATPase
MTQSRNTPTTQHSSALSLAEAAKIASDLRQRVSRSIFGQEDLITEALTCLIAGGHVLLTGAPGLAKTTLVRVFARHLGLRYGRVQFTPDLLPGDITGSEVLNIDPATGQRHFAFQPGPIFVNLLLADEINRSSPRTQSALLEAMQERTVTSGTTTHHLAHPFMVFATQNPFESEGTFPLPEAQLDRFLMHALVPYPSLQAEAQILAEHTAGRLAGEVSPQEFSASTSEPPLAPEILAALIQRAKEVSVPEPILGLIRDLTRSTRPEDPLCPEALRDSIWFGASPRSGIALISCARALALLEGEDTVRWNHVRRLARPVLRHRVRLNARLRRHQGDIDPIIDTLVSAVEASAANTSQGIFPANATTVPAAP